MYYSNITSATRTLCYKINPGVRVSILHIISSSYNTSAVFVRVRDIGTGGSGAGSRESYTLYIVHSIIRVRVRVRVRVSVRVRVCRYIECTIPYFLPQNLLPH